MKERRLPLGVDLGQARVRVAEMVVRSDGTARLLGAAGIDVGTDRSRALRAALKALGSNERRCLLTIRSSEAPLRTIRLPKMSPRERERAVTLEATAMLGREPEAVQARHVVLEDQTTLVVAALRSLVNEQVRLASGAGLRAVGVDHEGLALSRAGQLPLLDIGMSGSTLICLAGRVPHVRSIPIGGAEFTAALARDYGIASDLAENRKRTIGLAGAAGEVLARYIRAVEEELLDLRASEGIEIRSLRLCGNGARLRGLREAIQNDLGAIVEPVDLEALVDTDLPHDAQRVGAVDWFGAIAAAFGRAQVAA